MKICNNHKEILADIGKKYIVKYCYISFERNKKDKIITLYAIGNLSGYINYSFIESRVINSLFKKFLIKRIHVPEKIRKSFQSKKVLEVFVLTNDGINIANYTNAKNIVNGINNRIHNLNIELKSSIRRNRIWSKKLSNYKEIMNDEGIK